MAYDTAAWVGWTIISVFTLAALALTGTAVWDKRGRKPVSASGRREVVEHAIMMHGGGMHVRYDGPDMERAYPLQQWIKDNQRHKSVYRRRILVIDDWEQVPR